MMIIVPQACSERSEGIPDDLYDAARVDGATVWQRFWHITLPMLKPALLLALLFRTMDAFRVFDMVFVMTQGGPGDATQVLQFYGYQTQFTEGRIGYGSAVSVAVFLMILALSLTYLRAIGSSLLERSEHESSDPSRTRHPRYGGTQSAAVPLVCPHVVQVSG